jgi:hypothetical protein
MGYTGFSRKNFSSRFIAGAGDPDQRDSFLAGSRLRLFTGQALPLFLISCNQLPPT